MFSCPTRAAGRVTWTRRLAAALLAVFLLHAGGAAAQQTARDADSALAVSQAAIGRSIGDYSFKNHDGRTLRLADLRGKPVALSFIYTSCADTCPTITETLAEAAEKGWQALGKDKFHVVTVGFNAPADTPEAMRMFAANRGLKNRGWYWLSGELPEIAALADETGFVFFDSPKGFDHMAQITLIDAEGVVRAQVYGDDFEIRDFMEPMKSILIGSPIAGGVSLAERVRLFCTIYDPRAGKYVFDYTFFVEIFAGITVLTPVLWFLFRNAWRRLARAGRVRLNQRPLH